MGFLSNKISRDELNKGDHIYSWRKGIIYAHHGIYDGNGRVIHYTSDCNVFSSRLDDFLAGGSLYRFEYGVSSTTFLANPRGGACTTVPSDHPDDVIYRADYLLQTGFGDYDLIKNNCESFAVYCKTSLVFKEMAAASSQVLSGAWVVNSSVMSSMVSSMASSAMAAGMPAAAGMFAVQAGLYVMGGSIMRLNSDKDLKHQKKVPVERLASQINADRPMTSSNVFYR